MNEPLIEPATTFEFLERKVYLPGYMALTSGDYNGSRAIFGVQIKEPPVARVVNYFTPRELHIAVSQASFAIAEHLISEGRAEDMDIESFRRLVLEGRMRIVELNQSWRKEVEASRLIQGVFDIRRARNGRMPIVQLDFDFAEGAAYGNLTAVIARHPVPQTNADIVRI